VHLNKTAIAAAAAAALASPALAHHGFGMFDMQTPKVWEGVMTGMELVNPHSYMSFETVQPDGAKFAMRCEMRAASLIQRSGWSEEMFAKAVGKHVTIHGFPHREDPHSCYLDTFTVGDTTLNRNDQFAVAAVDVSKRPTHLPSGEPNISGDWAIEQGVLTITPGGDPKGNIVPRSVRDDFAAGKITLQEISARQAPRTPVVLTDAGKDAAKAFRMWSPEDNPRLACKPTSIIFDWTMDWPVNRITQRKAANSENVIVIDYGLYANTRTVHMDTKQHPGDLKPSNSGDSIGRWEGDTLVVDTIGFTPGVLTPPNRNSDKMHIVERFSVGTEKMADGKTEQLALRREYTVEDPVYLAQPYTGKDVSFISDTPWEKQPCKELTYEFQQKDGQRGGGQ
jgi:hypothetical protein